MNLTFVISGLVALAVLIPPLHSEEIGLELVESPKVASEFVPCELVYDDDEDWQNAEGLLSERAVTVLAYYPLGLLEDGVLISFDWSGKDKGDPSVVVVDLDLDTEIDTGERLELKPIAAPLPAAESNTNRVLCAARLDLAAALEEGDGPLWCNLYVAAAAFEEEEPEEVDLSFGAWGHLEGHVLLDGRDCAVVLCDHNLNGVFGDFAEGAGGSADTLAIRGSDHKPLRSKMVFGAQAFEVGLGDARRRLSLESIEVAMGRIDLARTDLEVELAHSGWGTQTLRGGPRHFLPAGTWSIEGFRRFDGDSGAACVFGGLPQEKVVVRDGEETCVQLDTTLVASVTMKAVRQTVRLDLGLVTSQGAAFEEFIQPAAANGLEGVPFTITDGKGKVVEQSHFTFG